MSLGQVFIIGGLNFQLFRILLAVGLLRVLVKQEYSDFEFTLLDKLFLWWIFATIVLGTLAEPSSARFINRSGEAYNAFGAYFLFRCWITKMDDATHLVRFMAVMIVPLAVSMAVEKHTGKNIFSVFGGVPEITVEREGRLRCQGAFRHPILAGTYAATIIPLFAGLWFQRGTDKWRAIIGGCCAALATIAAASSGALLAMIGGFIGFMFWRIRYQMRFFRWMTIIMIVCLAIMMKAPVWYLIARISEITGGTGWHRSYLIDQAIQHFGEWWLVGSTYTAHWAPGGQVLIVDPNNMDITNHYIAEGLGGGVVKLGLFLSMIVVCFKSIGRWIRQRGMNFSQRIFIWSLGVCLTAHCVSFLSVSYFDQIVVMWYWLLAIMALLGIKRKAVWKNKSQVRPLEADAFASVQ